VCVCVRIPSYTRAIFCASVQRVLQCLLPEWPQRCRLLHVRSNLTAGEPTLVVQGLNGLTDPGQTAKIQCHLLGADKAAHEHTRNLNV
jgi:hypothetical protein